MMNIEHKEVDGESERHAETKQPYLNYFAFTMSTNILVDILFF